MPEQRFEMREHVDDVNIQLLQVLLDRSQLVPLFRHRHQPDDVQSVCLGA
jgi:hypothetical protein